MNIIINGSEYPLSSRLRVAYKIQGMNQHKPYTEVFKSMGEMTLEKQIELLYAAFADANPDVAKELSQQQFLDYYLDNFTLDDVMQQLKAVMEGIMGKPLDLDEKPGASAGGNE